MKVKGPYLRHELSLELADNGALVGRERQLPPDGGPANGRPPRLATLRVRVAVPRLGRPGRRVSGGRAELSRDDPVVQQAEGDDGVDEHRQAHQWHLVVLPPLRRYTSHVSLFKRELTNRVASL